MRKTIVIYAVVLAIAAFLLEWLEYRYAIRAVSTELYLLLIAAGFTILGIWAGHRLTRKHAAPGFEKNDAAISSLGITEREYAVLEQLAAGNSNKEIARTLEVSPNTVKTHITHLYEKLDVNRRTQAVQRARHLQLIP